jgi:hypothetical protein
MFAVYLAVVLTADPGALQQAQSLYDELKYPEAAKAIAQVRAQKELPRADLLQALWLEGLCAVSMNRPDDARTPWRELAFLDPDFAPPGELPPKLLTPWYEARGWATTQKHLGFEAKVVNGTLSFTVTADPLKIVTGIRVHLKTGEEEKDFERGVPPQVVPLAGVTAWWAELTGGNGEVLAFSGTAEKPNTVGPEVKVEKEKEQPPPEVHIPTEHNPRLVPLVLGGVAVIAGAVGIATGITSSDAKSKYDQAGRLNDGTIYTLTQRQAASLRSQHDNFAVAANVCFGLAIAAAAAAVIYFFVGPKETW